jgi:hypothetical protein
MRRRCFVIAQRPDEAAFLVRVRCRCTTATYERRGYALVWIAEGMAVADIYARMSATVENSQTRSVAVEA